MTNARPAAGGFWSRLCFSYTSAHPVAVGQKAHSVCMPGCCPFVCTCKMHGTPDHSGHKLK